MLCWCSFCQEHLESTVSLISGSSRGTTSLIGRKCNTLTMGKLLSHPLSPHPLSPPLLPHSYLPSFPLFSLPIPLHCSPSVFLSIFFSPPPLSLPTPSPSFSLHLPLSSSPSPSLLPPPSSLPHLFLLTEVLVGERFEFRCGGRQGYWHFNGSRIGQVEPTSVYSGIATINLNGMFTCTNLDRTVEYSSTIVRVYGECGG